MIPQSITIPQMNPVVQRMQRHGRSFLLRIAIPKRCDVISASLTRIMNNGGGAIDFSAWSGEEKHWYADLVAQADGERCSAAAAPAKLAVLNQLLWSECVLLEPNGVDRHADTRGILWSDDRTGRWFATVERKIVWLQRKLAALRYGRPPADGELVCHTCGYCYCIRLGHIRYQSLSEDRKDRRHHALKGRGSFRPELLALLP